MKKAFVLEAFLLRDESVNFRGITLVDMKYINSAALSK
jgi:hypothetical protein